MVAAGRVAVATAMAVAATARGGLAAAGLAMMKAAAREAAVEKAGEFAVGRYHYYQNPLLRSPPRNKRGNLDWNVGMRCFLTSVFGRCSWKSRTSHQSMYRSQLHIPDIY